jgi:uncharacterized membrane protein
MVSESPRISRRSKLFAGSSADRAAKRLVVLLSGIGILHFIAPKYFDAIIPPALPGSARTYTFASGVAELAVAGTLAVPRTRRFGGLAAALLFAGVFPGNVQMAVDWLRNPKMPLPMKIIAIARLPLQIPMITTALAVRRTSR